MITYNEVLNHFVTCTRSVVFSFLSGTNIIAADVLSYKCTRGYLGIYTYRYAIRIDMNLGMYNHIIKYLEQQFFFGGTVAKPVQYENQEEIDDINNTLYIL